MKTFPAPEPLETRISPAVFFASGASLTIKNAANASIPGDAAAATFVGVDFALVLAKGDRLYLDLDGDVTGTTNDQTLLAAVTQGSGMFFLEDHGAGNFADAGFEGLAVSDKFAGRVTRTIFGDVVTALTAGGALARNGADVLIQKSEIAGLSLLDGADVEGSILASGKISDIIGTPGSQVVGAITNEPAFFNSGVGLGSNVSSEDYLAPTAMAGAAGPSISGVILDDVSSIQAASGLPKANSGGGAGGSISNVFIANSDGTTIVAGNGAVGGGSGKGGAGGSVKNVNIVTAGGAAIVNAGAGGGRAGSAGTGGGGAGGSLSNINVTDSSENAFVVLNAGFGGNAITATGPSSSGGAGGSIVNSSVSLTYHGSVFANAGPGGSAHSGSGGAGGSITGTSIVMNDGGSLGTNIGFGGFSEDGKGGAGGSYVNDSVLIKGAVVQSGLGLFSAGAGGSGRTGGGAGGNVSNSSLRIVGDGSTLMSVPPPPVGFEADVFLGGDLQIGGGSGGGLLGSGQSLAIKPGKGGAVLGFDLILGSGASLPGGIVVAGGHAGHGAGGSSGAVGGAINKLTVDVAGTLGAGEGLPPGGLEEVSGAVIIGPSSSGHIAVLGGHGSDAGTDVSSNGSGGLGGAVTGINIIQHGDYGVGALSTVTILGGSGGSGSGSGKGGAGGAVGSGGAPISVRSTTAITGGVVLCAGNGGDGSLGGTGGSVNSISLLLDDTGGFTENGVAVLGGHAGNSSTMKGAVGGGVLNVSVVVGGDLNGHLILAAGSGGDSAASPLFKGGNGGAVQKPSITLYGSGSSVEVYGGGGGNGITGGKGGAVSGTQLNYFDFVGYTYIEGGLGGGGLLPSSTGGAGGAVTNAAIRDFDANLFDIAGGDGGEVSTGAGGAGGLVSGVKLDAMESDVILYGGEGGSSENGTGGAGGSVATVTGVVGEFAAYAGNGGFGSTTGGAGGSVQGINILATNRVSVLRAGDGGDGTTTGGSGGKVTGIVVVGDIGDFEPGVETGLGDFGVIVGQGGAGTSAGQNGFITGVTASRISTIMAGNTENGIPTAANAVLKIAGIKASVIGADVNRDGLFDFIDNGGTTDFELGVDTPIDGFVLVKTGGVTASSFGGIIPLKLLQS